MVDILRVENSSCVYIQYLSTTFLKHYKKFFVYPSNENSSSFDRKKMQVRVIADSQITNEKRKMIALTINYFYYSFIIKFLKKVNVRLFNKENIQKTGLLCLKLWSADKKSIRSLFRSIKNASQKRHLPSFRTKASGMARYLNIHKIMTTSFTIYLWIYVWKVSLSFCFLTLTYFNW